MNKIDRYADIALSNFDIMKLVNNKANLILYPDVHKYKNIDDILGKYGSCFLLYESKPSWGHWTVLNKLNPNTIEFFDPYGGDDEGYPDETLKHIDDKFKKKTNQDKRYLSHLLYDSGYDIDYNQYKFQKHKNDIKTCGRHCAVRTICKWMSLDDYYNFFKQMTKELGMTNDEFVTFLTMYINK
jgi:hypothetical protein